MLINLGMVLFISPIISSLFNSIVAKVGARARDQRRNQPLKKRKGDEAPKGTVRRRPSAFMAMELTDVQPAAEEKPQPLSGDVRASEAQSQQMDPPAYSSLAVAVKTPAASDEKELAESASAHLPHAQNIPSEDKSAIKDENEKIRGENPVESRSSEEATPAAGTEVTRAQVVLSRAMSKQILHVTAELQAAKEQLELQKKQQMLKEQQQILKEQQQKAEQESLRKEMDELKATIRGL
jgi:hypothetical protein